MSQVAKKLSYYCDRCRKPKMNKTIVEHFHNCQTCANVYAEKCKNEKNRDKKKQYCDEYRLLLRRVKEAENNIKEQIEKDHKQNMKLLALKKLPKPRKGF